MVEEVWPTEEDLKKLDWSLNVRFIKLQNDLLYLSSSQIRAPSETMKIVLIIQFYIDSEYWLFGG